MKIRKIVSFLCNAKIFATSVLFVGLLVCSPFAYCGENIANQKVDKVTSDSVEMQIASLIKKEFAREDLEVHVSLTPTKIISKLDARFISSINLDFFDGAKQKCRATIESNLPKHCKVIATYSFSKVIPVLKRNLRPGEVITLSDVILQRCDAPFVEWSGANLVQNKERIIGKHSSVKLKAKAPIYVDPFSSISTVPN
jgi:hypothetical protein